MGNNTSSQSSIVNDQLIVNENNMKIFNENINKSVLNFAEKNTKTCDNTSSASQSVVNDFGNVKGDFVIGAVTLDMKTDVATKCFQSTDFRMDLMKEIAQKMVNDITDNMSQSAKTDLAAKAAAVKKTEFLSMPSFMDNTNSNSSVVNKTDQRNITNTNLTNIVANITEQTITKDFVNKCVNKNSNNQSVLNKANDVGGSVRIGDVNFKLDSKAVMECLQMDKQIQTIAEKATAEMGLKLVTSKDAKNETKVSSEAKAESINEGLFSGLGKMQVISAIASVVVLIAIIAILYGVNKFAQDNPELMKDLVGKIPKK